MTPRTIAFAGVCLLSAVASRGETRDSVISAIVNPEDLSSTRDGRWVFSSGMARGNEVGGALYVINTQTNVVTRLYPGSGHTSVPPKQKSSCSGEVKASSFAPHGIALHKDQSSGKTMLFVVNHGERESIEIFDVALGPKPRLTWRDCAITPPGWRQNAVAVTDSLEIFVTVSPSATSPQRSKQERRSGVLSWSSDRGWERVADADVVSSNGILVDADGQRIYVASWGGREIVVLDRAQRSISRRTIPLNFMPDNIRWVAEGRILAAGHHGERTEVAKCYEAPLGTCTTPSEIAEIDVRRGVVVCTARTSVDFATAAIKVADDIWIGRVHGDGIERWRIRRGQPGACH